MKDVEGKDEDVASDASETAFKCIQTGYNKDMKRTKLQKEPVG